MSITRMGTYVSTGSGIMMIDDVLMTSENWLEPIVAAKGGNVMLINGDGVFQKNTGLPIITMARAIYDIDTQESIGTLFVNITPSVLSDASRNLELEREICIFDLHGNVLSGDESLAEYFDIETVTDGFHYEVIKHKLGRRILSSYSTEDMPFILVSLSESE